MLKRVGCIGEVLGGGEGLGYLLGRGWEMLEVLRMNLVELEL